jgi:transaldolase
VSVFTAAMCVPRSFVQGVAAAQAGVSVVQPNVGRTRDWYNKHPGIIRDPHVRSESTLRGRQQETVEPVVC